MDVHDFSIVTDGIHWAINHCFRKPIPHPDNTAFNLNVIAVKEINVIMSIQKYSHIHDVITSYCQRHAMMLHYSNDSQQWTSETGISHFILC